jgi:hypothetical protein
MRLKITFAVTGLFLCVLTIAGIVGTRLAAIPSFPIRLHDATECHPVMSLENIVIYEASINQDRRCFVSENIENRLRHRWRLYWEQFAIRAGIIGGIQSPPLIRGFVERRAGLTIRWLCIAGQSHISRGRFSGIDKVNLKTPRLIELWDAIYTAEHNPRTLIQSNRVLGGLNGFLGRISHCLHVFLSGMDDRFEMCGAVLKLVSSSRSLGGCIIKLSRVPPLAISQD